MSFIYLFPKKLDAALRWLDLRHSRIDHTALHRRKFLEGYSPLALWLPIPLLVALAYGALRPRGWLLGLFCAAVIAAHVLACRWLKKRLMPQIQWVLVVLLVVAVGLLSLGGSNRAWSSDPYFHVFGPFAVFVLALGMPACRWWADWLIARKGLRETFRKCFVPHLGKTQLYVKPPSVKPPNRPVRILRAFLLVPLTSPLLLVLFPSFSLLVAPVGAVKLVSISTLVVTWALLAAAHYEDRLKYFQILLRQAFLVGWPGAVSFLVIILAAARIAGVSYVTTVLDQASWTIIVGLVVIFYLIFGLYDYWRQRALAEVLLGLLHKGEDEHPHRLPYGKEDEVHSAGHLQIHGAGRFIAIRPASETSGHEWEFESYQPLEVFRRIHRQLVGRARTEPANWREADNVAVCLDTLEEKVRLYTAVPALVVATVIVGSGWLVFNLGQEPAYGAKAVAAETQGGSFELLRALESAPKGQTSFAVAASGGGTRAALWAYEVLRELHRRDALERVVLLSSVSGGSAGVAYFAGHRDELLEGSPADWCGFREAMAERYIHQVLSGVGEWRMVTGTRLGELLTESFERKFFGASAPGGACTHLGCLDELGVIFNTAITGSWEEGVSADCDCVAADRPKHKCGTLRRTGSRLVLTNVGSMTGTRERYRTCEEAKRNGPAASGRGWPLDFEYVVVKNADVPLNTAASLSANFPPVFSNALVQVGSGKTANRYWVTDGGAVENRGVVSLLLALKAELEQAEGQAYELPDLKILVAEASGLSSPLYKEDRGLGAVGAAKAKMANKLIAELLRDVGKAYGEQGGGARVEIVYLPMPTALRTAFGTHWQMPKKIKVSDPDLWYRSSKPIALDTTEILDVIDLVFAADQKERSSRALCKPARNQWLQEEEAATLWSWLGKDWEEPLAQFDAVVPRPTS
ncbi:MAG: hypothetical protein GY769_18570 [bacterium]|nr:hypothetical protein [bacterium]